MSETTNSSEETVRPSSPQPNTTESTMQVSSVEDESSQLMSRMSIGSPESHDAERSRSSPSQWSSDSRDPLPQTIRSSSGQGDKYKVIPVLVTNNLQLIEWKMDKHHNPIFTSESEKERIQCGRHQSAVKHSAFWLSPVRYQPSNIELDVYRTVQIDHIPKECQAKDVLNEICWGVVESIQLVDVGKIKGPQGLMPAPHQFARIVFVKERHASKFQRYAHNKPLTMSGQPVRVYVQMEPTFPRTEEADEAIFENGMTRILSVFGLTGRLENELPAFLKRYGVPDLVSLRTQSHRPQGDEHDRFENKTVMEFRSIVHAYRAFGVMRNGGYQDAVGFMVEPDYCARFA